MANVKILLRRGARSEISADTLDPGELGFSSEDTNQLYVGTDDLIDQIVFDPFANAQAIVQTFLDTYTAEEGLEIDEDLVIKNVSNVNDLITAMESATTFDVSIFGRARRNVEVLTENSFSQVFANMHLKSHTALDGKRPDLFKKELLSTTGTFLKYAASDSTSFFIDYSLKQVGTLDTFVRVGTIRIINGHATTPPLIGLVKLTDDNTEIWQDDGDGTAEADEFSNIEFTSFIDNALRIAGFSIQPDVKYKIVTINDGLSGADTDFTLIGAADNNVGTVFTATRTDITAGSFEIGESYTIKTVGTTDFTLVGATDSNIGTVFTATGVGTGTGIATNSGTGTGSGTVELAVIPMNITYTQDANFTTEISYTVKRWTM